MLEVKPVKQNRVAARTEYRVPMREETGESFEAALISAARQQAAPQSLARADDPASLVVVDASLHA